MIMKGILKKITNNFSFKIIAILIGIILWFYVSGIKNSEKIVNIPLEIVNLPANAMIVSPLPQNITMKIRGPRALLFRLLSSNLRYTIDATGMQLGNNVFNFTGEQLEFPPGIQTVWVSPATLTIVVAETIKKKLTVIPRIEGTPGKGYSINGYTVTPEVVEVEGSKDSIMGLDKIYTKPIDISGEVENVTGQEVLLDLHQIQYKSIDADRVQVDIFITPTYITKILNNVRVTLKGQNMNLKYIMYPETIDIQISGPENLLEEFPLKDMNVYINIENMNPGEYTVKPVVEVPDGIRVEALKPDVVKLVIKR